MSPARIVVVDSHPTPVILTSYGPEGEVIQVALTPHRALAIAEELLVAARRRLRQGDR
jgi:hypothetical protein